MAKMSGNALRIKRERRSVLLVLTRIGNRMLGKHQIEIRQLSSFLLMNEESIKRFLIFYSNSFSPHPQPTYPPSPLNIPKR